MRILKLIKLSCSFDLTSNSHNQFTISWDAWYCNPHKVVAHKRFITRQLWHLHVPGYHGTYMYQVIVAPTCTRPLRYLPTPGHCGTYMYVFKTYVIKALCDKPVFGTLRSILIHWLDDKQIAQRTNQTTDFMACSSKTISFYILLMHLLLLG